MLRDEQAYALLARWIPDLEPAERQGLGDKMAVRFDDPEIQARTFAPLILAAIVEQGDYDPSWLAAFAWWYPTETDVYGYDQQVDQQHAYCRMLYLLADRGVRPDWTGDPEVLRHHKFLRQRLASGGLRLLPSLDSLAMLTSPH